MKIMTKKVVRNRVRKNKKKTRCRWRVEMRRRLVRRPGRRLIRMNKTAVSTFIIRLKPTR
jgi:hypothetical protein